MVVCVTVMRLFTEFNSLGIVQLQGFCKSCVNVGAYALALLGTFSFTFTVEEWRIGHPVRKIHLHLRGYWFGLKPDGSPAIERRGMG